MQRLSAWLDRVLEQPASTRNVALLRIGLALVIFTRFGDAMMLGGHLQPAALALVLAFWVGTLAMLAGFHAQLATALTAATLTASGYVTQPPGWAHHHVYLLISATACLAFTPCGRSYSIDRWRALARIRSEAEAPISERGLVGAQYLIGIQLSAVYFWGALDKCQAGWLSGDKLHSQLLSHLFDSDPPDVPGWSAMMAAAAIGTVVLEFALAIGLWIPRVRRLLIPAGIAFHVLIYISLPVTIFSALSCLLYLAYLDPDEVHRAIDRLSS